MALAGLTSGFGGDERNRREAGAVPRDVPGQQPVPANRGVRADVEVRERGSPLAAPPAVGQKCLARHEARLVPQSLPLEVGYADGGVATALQQAETAEAERATALVSPVSTRCGASRRPPEGP